MDVKGGGLEGILFHRFCKVYHILYENTGYVDTTRLDQYTTFVHYYIIRGRVITNKVDYASTF